MARVIRCPDCEKTLKIPDDKAGRVFKCPQCGKKLRAPGAKTSGGEAPRRKKPVKKPVKKPRREEELPDYSDEPELPPTGRRNKSGKAKKKTASGQLQPFLRRWLIGCGIFLGITAVIGIGGGLVSEVIALGAAIACVVAIIGCVAVGRIWMAIDLGKESLGQGLAAFFIPLYAILMTVQKRGPSMRGGIVYVSAIAPALLGLVLSLAFGPGVSGGSSYESRVERAMELTRKAEELSTDKKTVNTATLRVISNTNEMPNLQAKCEPLLSQFSSYERGSLKVDVEANTLTLQYRGAQNIPNGYALYLGPSTETIMSVVR